MTECADTITVQIDTRMRPQISPDVSGDVAGNKVIQGNRSSVPCGAVMRLDNSSIDLLLKRGYGNSSLILEMLLPLDEAFFEDGMPYASIVDEGIDIDLRDLRKYSYNIPKTFAILTEDWEVSGQPKAFEAHYPNGDEEMSVLFTYELERRMVRNPW